MAVGSSTLGLLFKIGVDAGDAEKQIGGIRKLWDDMVAAGKKGLGEGAVQGTKDIEKGITSAGGALQKFGTQALQARAGFNEVFGGNAIGGVVNLTRAFGPLGIAIGGVAIAAAAVGFAIKGAFDTAKDIGTKWREDFDALQKKVQSAGQSITELQRGLSLGILAALDQISGATTALFARVIEKDGRALIALLKEVANFITETLIPLVDQFGDKFSDVIANTIALWRTLNHDFSFSDWITGLQELQSVFDENLKNVKAEIAAINPLTAALVSHKKAREDLTKLQSDENKAARELALQRAKEVEQLANVDRALRAGAITVDEAMNKRLAILANTRLFEIALLDAQKARIEGEVQGARRNKDALAEIENKREIQLKEGAAKETAIQQQQDKDQTKFTEARLKELDQIIEKEKELDAIIKARAKAAQEAPLPIPEQVPGIAPEILLPKPPKSFLDDLMKSLEDSGVGIKSWADFVSGAIQQVVGATQQLLTTFILTGKGGGAAFKQLAASIIASLAVQAGVEAIMEIARGLRELANAAADAVTAPWKVPNDLLSAHLHFASATQFGIIAGGAAAVGIGLGLAGGIGGGASAAAGGGGFGGEQKPGEITINQGAASPLGIQLGILNALSNITTASPGDVLTRGAEQNPMVIGQANNEASRRDGSISREFLQISGLRTA